MLDGDGAVAAVLSMAAATYGCRAAGYLVVQRLRPGPFLESWLGHIPGAMFVSLTLPIVVNGPPAGWCAAIVTVALARLGAGLFASVAAGVAVVWAADQLPL